MKLLAWMLALFIVAFVHAQDSIEHIAEASKSVFFQKAGEYFGEGKYQAALEELKIAEQKLLSDKNSDKAKLGLLYYWEGITCNRLQDFPCSIQNFDKALGMGYSPLDINYEYGQALFAAEKLAEARLQFRESIKRNFKRAVSLYYVAFVSREMGERKKAFTFFRSIEKLDPSESKEVLQAARMQIGDIYLDQVEKHPDAFRAVETYVIPQYEKALAVDTESRLAPVIKQKIIDLQRKYDLILFQLRNGRPTLSPPYFARAAMEYGVDDNVIFSPNGTTVAESDKASTFVKTSGMGRYTFYHEDYISIAPEFSLSYTRYLNRKSEIYKNDNLVLTPAIRSGHEHTLFKKPAAALLDYDYTEVKRDVNSKQQLDFNSRAHAFMVGERFNFFDRGETVTRLRYRMNDSYQSAQDSTTISLVFEQIVGFQAYTFLLYGSYDRTRMKDDSYDTDSFLLRGDLIMSRVRDWFTPSIGLALTSTDPINDRSARGRELLINPNARLAKTFGKNWRGNFKYDYQRYNSKDQTGFDYTKSIYSFELEYLF